MWLIKNIADVLKTKYKMGERKAARNRVGVKFNYGRRR